MEPIDAAERGFVAAEGVPDTVKKALALADGLKNLRVLWKMSLKTSKQLDPVGLVLVWSKGGVVLPAKGDLLCE